MTEKIETIMKNAEVGYTPGVDPVPDFTPKHAYATAPEVPTTSTTDFEAVIKELSMSTTALEKVSALKKLESIATGKQKDLIGATNREFKNLQTNNPKKKQFVVNGCVFKSYTKPAAYDWPDKVLRKEAELKQAKAAAKEDGTAILKQVSPDIETDKSFSVSVMP
jgi:hypothetical protein